MSPTTVTFAEILAAARVGRARIAPEIAGYLALGVADALVGRAFALDAQTCLLTEDGAILVGPPTAPTAQTTALDLEQAARSLLGSLMDVARGGGATLIAVANRPASGDIGALIAEIEGALIPVNRAAARRALARLSRETAKARNEGHLDAARAKTPEPLPVRERDEDTEPLRVPLRTTSSSLPPKPSAPPQASAVTEIAEPSPSPEPPRASVPRVETPSSAPPGRTRADELLARFAGTVAQDEQDLARELKAMAGLEPTPPPPPASVSEPTPSPGFVQPSPSPEPKEREVAPPEAPALEEPFPDDELFDVPFARRSRMGTYLLGGMLVFGALLTIAAWVYYPELFKGR